MNYTIDKANNRGFSDHGWLKTHNTFSFADYYNPKKMNFGAFRVLNDDYIAAGTGFDTHSHRNMEIISIPISGEMEHKDNTGNQKVLKQGEIQMMSAGSGIRHSEYNRSDKEINFLQLWIIPNIANIEPTYKNLQTEIDGDDPFRMIVSNRGDGLLHINQDARIYLGNLESESEIELQTDSQTHGYYLFVISGELEFNGIKLESRDGIGITDVDKFTVKALSPTRLLAVEVPMDY